MRAEDVDGVLGMPGAGESPAAAGAMTVHRGPVALGELKLLDVLVARFWNWKRPKSTADQMACSGRVRAVRGARMLMQR